MIEEIAKVVRCEDDVAWLETQRQTSCGACSANKACGTSVLSKWIGNKTVQIKAINPVAAVEGDMVLVGMKESALLKGSLAVYMIPLVFMLLFAVTGKVLAGQMAWQTELVVILFAILGLVTAGLWLRSFTRRIQHDNDYQPVVLRRLPTPFVAQHSIQGH